MSVHADVDAKILEWLADGPMTYGVLCIHMREIDDRLLDRRLQALRKAGKAKFERRAGGWRLAVL